PSTVFLSTYRNTPSSRLLFATSLYDHRYLHSFPTRRSSDLDSSEISESVNFCVMEAIKLCRLDTPIIFIEARINLIGVSNLQSFIASMTQKLTLCRLDTPIIFIEARINLIGVSN